MLPCCKALAIFCGVGVMVALVALACRPAEDGVSSVEDRVL